MLGCPITSQRGHIEEYLCSLPYEYAISILVVYFALIIFIFILFKFENLIFYFSKAICHFIFLLSPCRIARFLSKEDQ